MPSGDLHSGEPDWRGQEIPADWDGQSTAGSLSISGGNDADRAGLATAIAQGQAWTPPDWSEVVQRLEHLDTHITLRQMCQVLSISRELAADTLAENPEIGAYQISAGGHWHIPTQGLMRWVRRQQVNVVRRHPEPEVTPDVPRVFRDGHDFLI